MILDSSGRELRRRAGFIGGFAPVRTTEKMQSDAVGSQYVPCEQYYPVSDCKVLKVPSGGRRTPRT